MPDVRMRLLCDSDISVKMIRKMPRNTFVTIEDFKDALVRKLKV